MIRKIFAVMLCLTLLLPGFRVSALEKSIEELSEETGITNSESSFTIPYNESEARVYYGETGINLFTPEGNVYFPTNYGVLKLISVGDVDGDGYHEEQNVYLPFVRYVLGIVVAAYREFASRVSLLSTRGLSKPEIIREVIKETMGKITKAEIMAKCPDISHTTVQRALKELQESGEIIKIGGGRYTSYTWNREKK